MKSLVCDAFGPQGGLVMREVLTPDVGPGEVRIRVMAAGVSANDQLLVQGVTIPKPSLPFTPGSEVAGVVDAVGHGVQDIAVGDHVIALTNSGGFAEFAVVPHDAVVQIPDGMAYATAAGFILTYAPAHHALKQRAVLKAGETVLVLGAAGAGGLAAIEVAKMLGARVIAAASTDEKLQLAKRFGADHRINYTDIDMREALKVLTDGEGVDIVYDPVGGEEAESALRSLAFGGRHLIMGFAAGPAAPVSPNALHARGAALIGVQWSAYARRHPDVQADNLEELVAWYHAGKLKPAVGQVFAFEHGAEAIRAAADRGTMGRVVLDVGGREPTLSDIIGPGEPC